MSKRSYTKADKIHALRVIDLCEGSLSAASRELGIPRKTLSGWVAEAEKNRESFMADDSPLADGLTDKQRRYADARASGLNQTESAKVAGYSGDDKTLAEIGAQNSRLLKIQERIRQRVLSAASLTPDEVIGTLAEHMRGDVDDLLSESGFVALELARERGVTHLIKKLKYGEFGLSEVEFHSPQVAAVQLSKILGIEQEPAKNRTDVVKRMLLKLVAKGASKKQAAQDLINMAVNEDDVKTALAQIEAHENQPA